MNKTILFALITVPLCLGYLAFAQQSQYTYMDHIKPVLIESCASCHNYEDSYQNLVGPTSEDSPTTGILIVYPAKPDSSVLIWRLEGKLPNGSSIGRMPISKSLSAENIKIFRDWISQGAPELNPLVVEDSSWGEVKKLFR